MKPSSRTARKIILVRNEHPNEVVAFRMAPEVAGALALRGFEVEVRKIPARLGGVPWHKDADYERRRLNAVRQIARENSGAQVFSFHNTDEKLTRRPGMSVQRLGRPYPKNQHVVEVYCPYRAMPRGIAKHSEKFRDLIAAMAPREPSRPRKLFGLMSSKHRLERLASLEESERIGLFKEEFVNKLADAMLATAAKRKNKVPAKA